MSGVRELYEEATEEEGRKAAGAEPKTKTPHSDVGKKTNNSSMSIHQMGQQWSTYYCKFW